MSQAPILHFHGRFRFHMPEYNNNPANEAVAFDPSVPKADVLGLCGCDPSRYFEFRFADVTVTQVTYRDGTQATDDDAAIGEEVQLEGLLPDVSASAICAQLFAATLDVGSALRAKLETAIQSDLRLNVRPEGFTDETAAAHFDASATVFQPGELAGSRWFAELDATDLELHFQLNRYTRLDNDQTPEGARLMGDVYGYLRPQGPSGPLSGGQGPSGPLSGGHGHEAAPASDGVRTSGRRLVAHPRLRDDPAVERTFLLDTGSTPLIRITDIDGSYDVLDVDGLVTIRYLDFVPFLDRQYRTPEVDGYDVYFQGPSGPLSGEQGPSGPLSGEPSAGGRVPVGRFTGRHDEMVRTGGLLVFPLPAGAANHADLRLAVDVVQGASAQPLMIENDLDLVLESPRGLTLASGQAAEVSARVYRDNRPLPGHPVSVRTQGANGRSPVVASIEGGTLTTDGNGRVVATVRALDLTNTGGVNDPVTGGPLDSLPIDRYYGNYVYLEIDQPLRRTDPPVEQVELAVRVVHRIGPDDIPDVPTFRRHVAPLFSYYLRYFPWLHTFEAGPGYIQFLDLSDYATVSGMAGTIVGRLALDIDDFGRMPRSRDFPVGGVELIQRWIDTGLQE